MSQNVLVSEADIRQAQASRKTAKVIIPLDDILKQHRDTLETIQTRLHNPTLLMEAMITLSLRGVGTQVELCEVYSKSFAGPGKGAFPTEAMFVYAQAVLERITETWLNPPFDNPNLIIYEAHALPYPGDVLLMEIAYHDPLPA